MGDAPIKPQFSLKRLLSGLSLNGSSSKRASGARVGLAVGPTGLALAVVGESGLLEHCCFYSREEDAGQQLANLVESLSLEGVACSVVLHPIYYQLLLAERPPVDSAEMAQAVRWKIKDLLDYPLEKAAVAHFQLPEDAYRGRQKMVYAAALQKNTLQELVAPVEESGLAVDCVEISELALHNLSARMSADPGGIAYVQLYENGGIVNLVEDDQIYLSRSLDVGLDRFTPAGDNSAFFEALYLEIQRSLDFYESQLGKGIITQLRYAPGLAETAEIGQFLSAQLGLDVSVLDLTQLNLTATVDEELDEQMARCVTAIGAALGPSSGHSRSDENRSAA